MPKENRIQARIRAALKKIPGCKLIINHGSIYSEVGTPDIIGCIRGRCFVLEVKQPTGEAEKIQLYRLKEWFDAGALVGLVKSVEEAEFVVQFRKSNWSPQ